MAITKIQSNAFPSSIDLSSVDLTIGSGEITTANLADLNVTHAKLHTDMDLSGKTVTLPNLTKTQSIHRIEANTIPRLQLKRTGNNAGNGYIECLGADDSIDYKIAFAESAGLMTFEVAGIDAMNINGSGYVGIGTNNPGAAIQVVGNTAASQSIRIDANSNNPTQINLFNGYGARQGLIFSNNGSSGYTSFGMISENTALTFKTAAYNVSATSDLTTNWIERMRIDSSGRVGIGGPSTDASVLLHVEGNDTKANIHSSENNWAGLMLSSANSGSTVANWGIQTGPGIGGALRFYNSYSNVGEKVRINISGNVDIGNPGSDGALLQVQTNDSGKNSEIKIYKSSPSGSDRAQLSIGYNDSNRFVIYRPQNNADIFMDTSQSDSNIRIRTQEKDALVITDDQTVIAPKLTPKVLYWSDATSAYMNARQSPIKFHMYFQAPSGGATFHVARLITQTDWGHIDFEIKQKRTYYQPASSDGATFRWSGYYSSYTQAQIVNYNQLGSGGGTGATNWLSTQTFGPGGSDKIHESANGGYYRDAWGRDIKLSLGSYEGVLLEVTVYRSYNFVYGGEYSAYDIYPANFDGTATQTDADNWNFGRGLWFNVTEGLFAPYTDGTMDPADYNFADDEY